MTGIDRSRLLARGVLLLEAVWPALWPGLGACGVFLCVALLDLLPRLPPWLHLCALTMAAAGIAGLLFHGLHRVRWPDSAMADRRLEADSGLSHRPLAVLADRPVQTDEMSLALWRAHRARAARQVASLRLGAPRPGLARRDPRALRAGLIVALVACLTVAGRDAPSRIGAALQPVWLASVLPAAPELRAWLVPPPYTRLPPVFLRADTPAVPVPDGSHLTVGLTGAAGAPVLSLNGATEAFRTLDATSFQIDRDVTEGGSLAVRLGDATLGRWELIIVSDRAPAVAWTSPPGRAADSQQTRLPWTVEDDYGVVSLHAELRLKDRPDAAPIAIAIPMPAGGARSAKGVSQHDLTAHPWAGLPVVAILTGKDFPGQAGSSAPREFILPERPFLNPIARILIQIRKGLSLHPDDRGDEMEALDGLLQKPDTFGDDLGALLNLSGIYHKLVHSATVADIAEAQDRLWELAVHLEDGNTEATARALEEARQAAKEALEALLRDPSQGNRDALDARLAELQAAIDRHLQALMQEAARDGAPPATAEHQEALTEQEMRALTDRTRDAAKAGRPEDAQRRMAELERMLDKLRQVKPSGQNRQNAEQRQRGQQQMGAVQDMVRREGGVLDHAENRVERGLRFNRSPGAPDPNALREADRRIQQALRRSLGELMQEFGDLTGEVPPSLSEADQAMRDAGAAFAQGRDKAAGESVQQAIEALQKGAQDMGQTMMNKFGAGPPAMGQSEGEAGLLGMSIPGGRQPGPSQGLLPGERGRADSRGRDPLGRSTGTGGDENEDSNEATVPEDRERQRTLAIQEELRRREGEKGRPQPELDYIDRLLKRF